LLAVDGIDLEIPKGELFGFLGSNEAAKTTTIKLLVGLLKPTSGSIFIDGIDLGHNPI
jgi:ABC-2 type transport system ATP-binding protein